MTVERGGRYTQLVGSEIEITSKAWNETGEPGTQSWPELENGDRVCCFTFYASVG